MAEDSDLLLLPWVRRGGATAVAQVDSLTAAQPGVASTTASLTVNGTPAVSVGVRLMGPGHVIALQPGQIIRTYPTPGSRSFEPNNFPLVEFDEPSLPWLFTPASADARNRLRPWLCLLVVRRQAGVRIDPPRRGSVPVLSIAAPADPNAELPDLTTSWAWAHAQVTRGATSGSIEELLDRRPDLTLSRLVCGRILQPATDYTACVVPTFELGRLAGLGLDVPAAEEAQLRPAWTLDEGLTTVELPVFHSWDFATGPHGDFQSLALLLRARPLPPGVGERRIDVAGSSTGVTVPDGTTVALGGALQPVDGQPTGWPDEGVHDAVRTALADVLDAPDSMPVGVALLAPPRYGSTASGERALDPARRDRWYEQLNLEPAARAAAQFGTRVVQEHQEALVASAWEQAAALPDVTTVLRHAQFGRAVGWSLHRRHLNTMQPEAGLQAIAPAWARLSRTAAATAPDVGIVAMFAAAEVPMSALGSAMRRVARPQGAISRRTTRRAPTVTRNRSILTSLRPATRMGRLVTLPASDGMATIERVAQALQPPRADMTWVEASADTVRSAPPRPGFRITLPVTGRPGGPVVAPPTGPTLPLEPTRPPTRPTRPTGPTRPTRPTIEPFEPIDPLDRPGRPLRPGRPFRPAAERRPTDPGGDPFDPDPIDPDPIDPDPIDPFPRPPRTDSADATLFRTVAAAHLQRFDPRPLRPPVGPIRATDLGELYHAVLARMEPSETFAARVAVVVDRGTPPGPNDDPLAAITFTPQFGQPVAPALAALGQDLMLPGLDGVPPNTVVPLRTNTPFVEAVLVGFNTELGRELVWREFPTPLAATYADRFWDAGATVRPPDIPPLATWGDRPLGGAATTGERFVVLLRAELLRRYPDAVVYATNPDGTVLTPSFSGHMDPDVRFFGFEIAADAIAGWSIVIAEQPTAPRFGLEADSREPGTHAALTDADADAARLAARVRQQPVRVTIPATVLLGGGVMPTLVDLGPIITADPSSWPAELTAEVAPSTHPLALLPVRLETRFVAGPGGTCELLVRIYPDQVHIDAHDPLLSSEEVDWGRRYWQLQWRAGDDEARLRAAWRMLVDRFDAGRAAWIARRLTPINGADRPTAVVGEDDPIDREPQFTDLGEPAAVVRTPRAACLPARWVATAYREGRVVAIASGLPVAADLRVGPDPDDALAPDGEDPETVAVDAGMRWMVDFDTAVDAGMAMRLPLAVPIEQAVVDVLVVVGVGEEPPADGAARVAALVDCHHHTDGVAVLAPGTPTNNSGQERAGYVSRDRRGELSFPLEWPAAPPVLDASTDGGRICAALGLGGDRLRSTFGPVQGATSGEEGLAGAVQTALWPATWGYYLSQFAAGPGHEDRAWARDHTRRHVRPGGPLATLRIGRQPYGLLPVAPLAGWTDDGPDGARVEGLRRLLVGLRDQVWRPAARAVPRIGRSANVDADLVDVLATEAASRAHRLRRAIGPNFARHLRLFLGEDLDALGFVARLEALTAPLPRRVGVAPPALSSVLYEGATERVTVPLVRADGHAAAINALLAADPDALATELPTEAVPLLDALLRHGLLLANAEAGGHLLGEASPARDAELVDLVAGAPPSETWARRRARPVPGTNGSVADELRRRTDLATPELRALGELREAVAVLGAADPVAVERQVAAALDATSHRLDAWVTSLATRRLADLRRDQPTGLSTGGYGWLEDLRPEPGNVVAEPPPDEGPLTAPADDPGFIIAPSLAQATTAALLRGAHLAHGGRDDSPFAISLTSDRIRLAQRLFDGVRQGQSLGSLLGYDVERRLHEFGLDELTDDVRRFAPPADRDGDEAVAGRALVDGLVLHEEWRTIGDHVLDHVGLDLGDARRDRMRQVLVALDAAVDAAADAITAEGVHQLATGDLGRSAGTLGDIAAGDAPPPPLEVVRTPRTGTAVTHRVAVVLDASDVTTTGHGWADGSRSPRAAAEPRLDAWAARLLGPVTDVEVAVDELDDRGNTVATHRVPMSSLDLAALDLVWMSGDAGAAGELARRAYLAAVGDGVEEPAAFLRLDLTAPADRARRGVGDVLELATAARRVLAGARPLDGADLQPAHADPDRRADLDELERRSAAAQESLERAGRALGDLLDGEQATIGGLRRTLGAVAAYGVSAALAPLAGRADEAVLPGSAGIAMAAAVHAEVSRRLVAADREATPSPDETDTGRRDRVQRRMRAVFGPGFVAVAVFTAATAPALDASRRSPGLLDGDPLAADTWALRMERVRPALARLTMAYRLAEVLRTGPVLDLVVTQVPHDADRPWIGLRVEPGDGADGLVSLVLQGGRDLDLDAPLVGLLVDEWTEVVPSRTETAGLAFRYDPPDAMAPQAILLAVPPAVGRPWTVGSLNQVLLETLDLAHLRAVGPELLGAVGQYLPATMLAFNGEADVVSTDPNALIG